MQAVQAVDGLLTQAEGAVDVALAGALRIGVVGRLVKAEQEVRRRAEIPCDAAHDQCRRHRDLAPVVRLEVLAHGRTAHVDLIGQFLRVDGLAVHVVAVHQIGQPVTEYAAETAGGLVVVFAHENASCSGKQNFSNFFGKTLDKPVEMVYTKVTLIENETLVSINRPNQAFLTLSKAQLPA